MKVRNKLFSLVTAFAMTTTVLFGGMPALNLNVNAESSMVFAHGIAINDGYYLAEGKTEPTTIKPDDDYLYNKDGVLTMHNYNYQGITGDTKGAIQIGYTTNTVQTPITIMLEGENSIILTGSDSGQFGIWAAGSITIDGEGTLDLSGYRGITSAYSVVNIVDGNLNINTTKGNAIYTTEGLSISGGNIKINSELAGVYCESKTLIEGGTVVIDSNSSGIASAYVEINGGNTIIRSNAVEDDDSKQCAISTNEFTFGEYVTVSAASDPDGVAGEYVPKYHDNYDLIVTKGMDLALAKELEFSSLSPKPSAVELLDGESNLGEAKLGSDATDLTFYGFPKKLSDSAIEAGATVSRGIRVYRNDSEFYSRTYQDNEVFGWNLKENITDGGEYRIEVYISITDGDAYAEKKHTYTIYVIGSTIDYIEAFDLETPIVGKEPDYTVTCDIPGVYVHDVVWNYYDEKWEWLVMDDGAVFETGQRYEATIEFRTEDGFSFTETSDGMTAYINGMEATVVWNPYATNKAYVELEITPLGMGDINADGNFNVADVVALQKWIVCAKDAEKSIVEWKAGNFVDDDRLDAFDLSLMKRALLNS